MRFASKLVMSGALALALLQAAAQQRAPPDTPASDAEKTAANLQLGDPVEVGKPIQTVDPIVPDKFRKKKGFAVLHGIITTEGSFKDLAIVGGDRALAAPAIAAVQQWRYSPCTLNGAPVQLPIYLALNLRPRTVSRLPCPSTSRFLSISTKSA